MTSGTCCLVLRFVVDNVVGFERIVIISVSDHHVIILILNKRIGSNTSMSTTWHAYLCLSLSLSRSYRGIRV
jgi:hypothetical protein